MSFVGIGNDKSEEIIQILDVTVVQFRVATGDPSGSKRWSMEFFKSSQRTVQAYVTTAVECTP